MAALNRAMLETEGSLKRDWQMTDSGNLGETIARERSTPVAVAVLLKAGARES